MDLFWKCAGLDAACGIDDLASLLSVARLQETCWARSDMAEMGDLGGSWQEERLAIHGPSLTRCELYGLAESVDLCMPSLWHE